MNFPAQDGSGEIDPDEMEDIFKKLCKWDNFTFFNNSYTLNKYFFKVYPLLTSLKYVSIIFRS